MLLMSIDPGTTKSAYLIMGYADGKDKREIVSFGILENLEMKKFINHESPDELVIEMVSSFGMPVGKEIFETVRWIGKFEEQIAPDEAVLVYRRDIKIHLCGTSKAKDGNIRQVLIDRYGAPGTKKSPGFTYGISKDIWSALAIATFYLDTKRNGVTQKGVK